MLSYGATTNATDQPAAKVAAAPNTALLNRGVQQRVASSSFLPPMASPQLAPAAPQAPPPPQAPLVNTAAPTPPPVASAAAPPPPTAGASASDPNFGAFMEQMRGRIAQSQGREGQTDPNLQTQIDRLGERLGNDTTQHSINVANQGVNAQARAAQSGLRENLARRGISGSGVAAELGNRIQNQAQRSSAANAANISLGRERDKDALVLGGQNIMAAPGQMALQREGMTNSLLPLGLQGAQANASNNLGAQGLDLNRWQAQRGQENAQRGMDLGQWQTGLQNQLGQQGLNLSQWQAQNQQAQNAQNSAVNNAATQAQTSNAQMAQAMALQRMTQQGYQAPGVQSFWG